MRTDARQENPHARWIAHTVAGLHLLACLLGAIVLAWGWLNPAGVLPASLAEELPGWSPPWVLAVLSGLAWLGAVVSFRRPGAGVLALLPLAYGLPRAGAAWSFFLRWHVLEWTAALVGTGYFAWLVRRRSTPRWAMTSAGWVMVAMVAWCLLASAAAAYRLYWDPALNHHPILLAAGLVLLAASSDGLTSTRGVLAAGLVLAVTLAARAAGEWNLVYLNGDLGSLAAIAAVLAGALTLAGSRWWHKLLLAIPAVAMVALTAATANRGGVVALAAGAVAVWVAGRRKLLKLALASPVLAGGVAWVALGPLGKRIADIWQGGYWLRTVTERLDIWQAGVAMAADHPVLGVGIGNFRPHVGAYNLAVAGMSPHNNFVAMAAEAGLPALGLYVAAVSLAVIAGVRSSRRTGRGDGPGLYVAGALVAQVAGGCFMTRHTEAIAFILAGLAVGLWTRRQGGDDNRASRLYTVQPDSDGST